MNALASSPGQGTRPTAAGCTPRALTRCPIHSDRNECACQFAGSGDPAYSGRLYAACPHAVPTDAQIILSLCIGPPSLPRPLSESFSGTLLTVKSPINC